ncbi:Gfo/Idh/MocA family oxidoreductase [Streptosporangium sp. NPDC020145]|uniref:Gfo/Idh/MocA family protein n=1 Tax=Streptosporangium jomthongense TaxID=1193683 RepID=A0ABV8F405_9ACTN
MTGSIRFGVVGLGEIYQLAHHLAYQRADGLEAAVVCDLDPAVAERTARSLGARASTDYRELLDDDRIDAVDLVLPHNVHYEIAREFLEAGKHVLIEKPMTVDAGHARELVALAASKGLKFTVNENTRFIPAYQAALDAINGDEIGDVTLVRTLISGNEFERLGNPKLWKGRQDGSGGGTIIDAGAHSFYLLKWMFGEVASLRAMSDRLVDVSQVEDWSLVCGRTRSGALFSVESTFTSGGPWNERLEVHGTKGLIVVDQHQNPPAMIFHGKRDHEGSPLPGTAYEPTTWKYNSIAAGIESFARSIAKDEPTAVAPEDGAYAVRIIELAYESVATGRPVSL